MREARPSFVGGDDAALAEDKRFCHFALSGRKSRRLPKGTVIKVRRHEALFDAHGRFSRFWYYLYYDDTWEAIAEEYELVPAGVLDRLALFGDGNE